MGPPPLAGVSLAVIQALTVSFGVLLVQWDLSIGVPTVPMGGILCVTSGALPYLAYTTVVLAINDKVTPCQSMSCCWPGFDVHTGCQHRGCAD